MRLLDLVPPGCVVDDLRAGTKEEALREVSEAIAKAIPGIGAEVLEGILRDRESLGSTGIGEGVAIPHGKVPGIPRLYAALARSGPGVPFQALDGRPVHLFFLVVAPEKSAGMHLKALARISRLLKSARFRDALMAARDADDLRRVLKEEDDRS